MLIITIIIIIVVVVVVIIIVKFSCFNFISLEHEKEEERLGPQDLESL